MKAFCTLLLVLIAGAAYGQSNLPACQGIDTTKWNDCFGTWSSLNGDKYVGEWKGGLYHGQGNAIFGYVERFLGSWNQGKLNGRGTAVFASGTKYVGDWKNNNMDGLGTLFFADGSKFVGSFKDHKRNGNGVKFTSNGSIVESGFYLDDELVTSQYIDPNSFTNSEPNSKVKNESNQLAIEKLQIDQQQQLTVIPLLLIEIDGLEFQADPAEKKDFDLAMTTFRKGEFAGATNAFSTFLRKYPETGFRQSALYWLASANYVKREYLDASNQLKAFIAMNEAHVRFPEALLTLATSQIELKHYLEAKKSFEDLIAKYPNSEAALVAKERLPKLKIIDNSFAKQSSQTGSEKAQLEVDRRRLTEERRKFEGDKRQREQAQQKSRISISATATQPDSSGVVTISIQTNTDTSSLKINGEELGGKLDGSYSVKRVARVGQDTKFTIAGIDINGNTDTKTITVSRTIVESKVTYQQLNPDRIKRQPERDAVAVIIGISNYKSLPKADFAKDDAQVFYDYAIRALGVKPGNIKLLMDEQADAEEIYTAFKTWLPARVKSTTDVYVFYSGHGLPTPDGTGLYWLPQRVNRDLISKTAILMQEINSDIQASKPKSVTIFMDACYSGQARGGETLVASARPIALKSQPTTFPSNFTVITASQADQISSSSPDLQHGIFSYYLMRGMEGEADLNKDGKITLDEIQAYLSENVGRHARTMNRQQEPQVIGDGSRVLVGR